MRSNLTLVCLGVMAVLCLSAPVFAEESLDLQRVIELQQKQLEEQQRQLDAQQQQIEAQRNMLLDMQQKVQGLSQGVAASEPSDVKPKPPDTEKVAAKPSETTPPRRTDTQTARRDKDHPHEEWEGSFGVEALDTRFKIGGFAELDVIHDSDAIASEGPVYHLHHRDGG